MLCSTDKCPLGYMVILQSMAEIYPSLCLVNPSKTTDLLKSYVNRAPIGSALLWAIGQGGRKDLGVGIKGRKSPP